MKKIRSAANCKVHYAPEGEPATHCGKVLPTMSKEYRAWSPRAGAWTNDIKEATCNHCIRCWKRWTS